MYSRKGSPCWAHVHLFSHHKKMIALTGTAGFFFLFSFSFFFLNVAQFVRVVLMANLNRTFSQGAFQFILRGPSPAPTLSAGSIRARRKEFCAATGALINVSADVGAIY